MSTPQNETLKRTLGMREAVTITVGTVVGVGLFTTGAQIVGSMGSAVILATFMAMVISVYPSHLYAEMSAALPFAGGTYKYAQLGLGKAAGMLAGWNFIASLVAVTSGEALAFSFYFKTLFRAFGVELPISDVLLAAIPIVLFIVTNIHGTEMTGRLQNGFMFFFWGVAIIWALMMIPNIHLPSYMVLPESMNGLSGWSFIGMVAMIWWCFAGFETCCALGEEIKHPRINLPRALKLSPFIVFAVNAIFQWFLVGIVPPEHLGELADASAPFADGMAMAGILGLPMAFLAAGIAFGGDFSTLNSSIAVPPRYLFAMARDFTPVIRRRGCPFCSSARSRSFSYSIRSHLSPRSACLPTFSTTSSVSPPRLVYVSVTPSWAVRTRHRSLKSACLSASSSTRSCSSSLTAMPLSPVSSGAWSALWSTTSATLNMVTATS